MQEITVSDGNEFFRVPTEDVEAAIADGFYRPGDRGLTIVSDGHELFEIPLEDLSGAQQDGFRDLLADERTGIQVSPSHHAVAGDTNRAHSGTSVPDSEVVALGEDNKVGWERDLEFRKQLAHSEGFDKFKLYLQYYLAPDGANTKRRYGAFVFSAVLQGSALILLASFWLAQPSEEGGLFIAAAVSHDEAEEEDLSAEITLVEIPEQSSESAESLDTPLSEMQEQVDVQATDFMSAVDAPALDVAPSDAVAQPAVKTSSSFFGSETVASSFAFVIDNSASMTNGRFETALNELHKTVVKMTSEQSFYVVFYSDTAYHMFHPQPVKKLIPATARNKKALFDWLWTVELCFRTNGVEAIQSAFDVNPDTIYVLGDGAFTDKVIERFAKPGQDKIKLHTLGMEVKGKDVADFRRLAQANGGTYNDVGVDPQGREMANKMPRKKNKTRGRFWGIMLPNK